MKKFYTFLNQLHDSSLKTHFLCHDVKSRIRQQRARIIEVVLSKWKRRQKTHGSEFPIVIISIYIRLDTVQFLQERSRHKTKQKFTENRKHSHSTHNFGTTLVLKHQPFSAGSVLFMVIPRYLEKRIHRIIRKWHDTFFGKRKCETSNTCSIENFSCYQWNDLGRAPRSCFQNFYL